MRYYIVFETFHYLAGETEVQEVSGLCGAARDIKFWLDRRIGAAARKARQSPYKTVLQYEGSSADVKDMRSRLLTCSMLYQPDWRGHHPMTLPSDRLYEFGPVSRSLIQDMLDRGTPWTGENAQELGLPARAAGRVERLRRRA